ncbi:MAG: phosphatase PAP2 family protein [Holophagales bacterium]|nr:phosphatase PAP2 family protein [Holophagales bacterium]
MPPEAPSPEKWSTLAPPADDPLPRAGDSRLEADTGGSALDTAARWISICGHPFALILLYVLVGAATRLELRQALIAVAIVFVGGVLPMMLYLASLVRRSGANFDVSVRRERSGAYGLGLALGMGLLAVFASFDAPADLLGGLACGLLLVVLASLINLRLKVSLHSAFAVWVAVGFASIAPWASAMMLLFAALVVWSRLRLCRHTRGEVVAGVLLGAAMALPMLFLIGS